MEFWSVINETRPANIININYFYLAIPYWRGHLHLCLNVQIYPRMEKKYGWALNFVSVSSSAVMMSQVSVPWPAAWKRHWIKVSGGSRSWRSPGGCRHAYIYMYVYVCGGIFMTRINHVTGVRLWLSCKIIQRESGIMRNVNRRRWEEGASSVLSTNQPLHIAGIFSCFSTLFLLFHASCVLNLKFCIHLLDIVYLLLLLLHWPSHAFLYNSFITGFSAEINVALTFCLH